jgi:hypothetical protein
MEYWNDGCGGKRPISLICPSLDPIIPIIQYSNLPNMHQLGSESETLERFYGLDDLKNPQNVR